MCLQSVGDARKYCLRAGASYCGTAGARPATAVACIAASSTREGEGRTFWIGNADLDRNRDSGRVIFLSTSWPHAFAHFLTWA